MASQLNGLESEQTPGDVKDREAWRAIVHGLKEPNTTERLNNNNKLYIKKTAVKNTLEI